MTATPTTVIECPFQLVGNYKMKVDGVTVTLAASTGVWYRQILARGSAAGTASDPKMFTAAVVSTFGANWQNGVSTSGRNTIKWNSTGSKTITWDDGDGTGLILRDLMGFTGATAVFSAGETKTATNPPPYRIRTESRDNDSEWLPRNTGGAWSNTDSAAVYGVGSNRQLLERTFDLSFHPRDADSDVASSYDTTPLLPSRTGSLRTKLLNTTEDLPASRPSVPMSIHEIWSAARGRYLAGAFGTFQQIVALTVSTYEVFMLDAETCKAAKSLASLIRQEWNAAWRMHWGILMVDSGAGF